MAWQAYGALVGAASWLHYAALSRLGRSDEGGAEWFRRRLSPPLPQPASGRRIWIHAVSAGESKVAELLRQRLLERDPELSVVLSATTYSGFARVAAVAGEASSFIMPLDTLAAQRRVFDTVRPDLVILVESEFWPAQFAAAAEAGVPVLVVNATMSARSFARHRRHPAVARRTIARAGRIYAQDEAIASRYAALGVPPDRIEVIGNLKLVPSRPAGSIDRSPPPLVAFGNVHRDEIAGLAPAIAALRRARPDLRVVLVPRYPGKTPGEVLSAGFGADLRIIDTIDDLPEAGPLVWLDQMGALAAVYAQATVGVVCGTFSDVGGHDLSEPLHLGAASVYGPNVERQKPLHAALSALGCATQVASAEELPGVIAGLVDDKPRRDEMVAAFRTVSEEAAKRLDTLAAELVGQVVGN
ncbi:glycosyltransferase N-terminal domain-containing protein [Devosia sp.]|uniref:3-deoxy-D-manno-octulosonic acid transferase n=1 Tax=Devosia sp. TaxID=1871048 RepID=UPI001AD5745E|nr:glycosyltransferase N-terminal domain-containing protein [Devosia sp.]MBN9307910.1 glycosyltransferase [Devosia sp.]